MTIIPLANLYRRLGLYNIAEPLFQRALKINENALGEHPLDTTLILSNLALMYSQQGLYSKAEPLYLRALAIRVKVLGVEHPKSSISLNNLAGLYNNQGLYNKAQPLAKRALAIDFTFLQRQAPYLALSEHQSFVKNVGNAFESVFSSAARGDSGAELEIGRASCRERV